MSDVGLVLGPLRIGNKFDGDVYFETEAVRAKADARENPCRINGDNREFRASLRQSCDQESPEKDLCA